MLNDKNARDVTGLPFQSGARSGICNLQLLWFQWLAKFSKSADSFSTKSNHMTVENLMQGQLVYGEFRQSMRLEDGRTAPQWRIWIWQSEQVSKAGNLYMLVTSRY